MEINGSWLVPTHEAAGIPLGIAPLPKGPAGRATIGQRDRRRHQQGQQVARGGLGAGEVPGEPRGPGEDDGPQGRVPVNKEVLAGAYPTSFGARRSSPTPSPTRISSRLRGLRGVHDGASRRSSTRTSSMLPTRPRRGRASTADRATAERDPARPASDDGGSDAFARAADSSFGSADRPTPFAAATRRGAAVHSPREAAGRGCSWRRR